MMKAYIKDGFLKDNGVNRYSMPFAMYGILYCRRKNSRAAGRAKRNSRSDVKSDVSAQIRQQRRKKTVFLPEVSIPALSETLHSQKHFRVELTSYFSGKQCAICTEDFPENTMLGFRFVCGIVGCECSVMCGDCFVNRVFSDTLLYKDFVWMYENLSTTGYESVFPVDGDDEIHSDLITSLAARRMGQHWVCVSRHETQHVEIVGRYGMVVKRFFAPPRCLVIYPKMGTPVYMCLPGESNKAAAKRVYNEVFRRQIIRLCMANTIIETANNVYKYLKSITGSEAIGSDTWPLSLL